MTIGVGKGCHHLFYLKDVQNRSGRVLEGWRRAEFVKGAMEEIDS